MSKGIEKDFIKRGMYLVDPDNAEKPVWKFDAEIVILYHATTIRQGYQPVLHCNNIRQTVCMYKIHGEDTVLRTGSKAIVTFKFNKRPEVMPIGTRIIFRDGKAKAIGKVTAIDT